MNYNSIIISHRELIDTDLTLLELCALKGVPVISYNNYGKLAFRFAPNYDFMRYDNYKEIIIMWKKKDENVQN